MLFIDINLGEESSERIVVYEGDSAKDLALKFCEKHNLDDETQIKLEEQLAAQIRSVLSKIDEESTEIRQNDWYLPTITIVNYFISIYLHM